MSVISEEELREIVEVVWMTMLETPLSEDENSDFTSGNYLCAEVSITGAWEGMVALNASEAFLSYAASVMFSCSVAEVSELDRTDSLTELTNMLGGTVKCLLPETCDLSLPSILPGDIVEASKCDWHGFLCDGNPLAVSVQEAESDAQQAA